MCLVSAVHLHQCTPKSQKRQNTHVLGIGSRGRRTRRRHVSAGCTCGIISLRLFMTASLSATLNAGYTERAISAEYFVTASKKARRPPAWPMAGAAAPEGGDARGSSTVGRRRSTTCGRPRCIRYPAHLFRVLGIWVLREVLL
jgi:hypothetical protein